MADNAPGTGQEAGRPPVLATLGAIALMVVVTGVGAVPIGVGFNSERRDPGGGYVILGAITGLGHLMIGLLMLLEVFFTVGTGRGKTITRLARNLSWISFAPTVDFMVGLFGIGFGTIFMFAYTQTIADLPRLPQYAVGYTMDGWLGIWIVWASVFAGALFWALWLDAVLGREPAPKGAPAESEALPADEGYYYEEETPPPRRR